MSTLSAGVAVSLSNLILKAKEVVLEKRLKHLKVNLQFKQLSNYIYEFMVNAQCLQKHIKQKDKMHKFYLEKTSFSKTIF